MPARCVERSMIRMHGKRLRRRNVALQLIAAATWLAGCTAALPQPDPGSDTARHLERAIATGDASLVDDESVYLHAILGEIAAGRARFAPVLRELLAGDGHSLQPGGWQPTLRSPWLEPNFPRNTPVVEAQLHNWEHGLTAQGLAIVGMTGAGRYAVFSANPLRAHESLDADTHRFLENTVGWLTGRNEGRLDVVLAHLDESDAFPDESSTRSWLDGHFAGRVAYNLPKACDGERLESCLEGAGLLIISQFAADEDRAAAVRNVVERAMNRGLPVMYVHRDAGLEPLGRQLLDLLDVTWRRANAWYEPVAEVRRAPLPTHVADVETLLTHLRDGDVPADLARCGPDSCPADSWFTTVFRRAARAVGFIVDAEDVAHRSLFDQEGRRLEKLWVLLADHWRSRAAFPMDKRQSDPARFLKSLFADHAVHVYRAVNAAQPDMGNYSRSDFSHVTPVSRQVSLRAQLDYLSAGVYALPGRTVRITRSDDSAVTTEVQIGSLRPGTTHVFEPGGYNRPVSAGRSPAIPLAPGETIELTSPYGGPIHVYFDVADEDVSLRFDNVGLHPYWQGPGDTDAFLAALDAGDYDWAEFRSPYFEITSRAQMMRVTLADRLVAQDPEELSRLVTRYHHNIPRALGGYQGGGIDVPAEVREFADEHGLSLSAWDRVQHLNADQPICGSACAGNPYDAGWPFTPLSHGHLHEVGHGLESGRLRFTEWPVHASTNWYAYYPKYRFHAETGQDTGCAGLAYDALFARLQESRRQEDAKARVAALDFATNNDGAAVMLQMLAAAQHRGELEDGWMLLPRLHLLARGFDAATRDEESWLTARDGLGFGGLSLEAARGLSREDWLLIAASHASGVDFTAFLDMWGAPLGTLARNHVARRDYAALPPTFYAMTRTQHCYADFGEAIPVPVDGAAPWPELPDPDRRQGRAAFPPSRSHR